MIDFNDGGEYRLRAYRVWDQMQEPASWFSDPRDMDAGYCLDAVTCSPAGATWRIEPDNGGEPFAAPLRAWCRL